MSVLIIREQARDNEIKKAGEDYDNYIKLTIDIEKEVIALGGEFHADAEEKLLRIGSKQENIWGGGLNLETGEIETNAIINIRSRQNNPSNEIIDSKVRERFINIARNFLKNYVK